MSSQAYVVRPITVNTVEYIDHIIHASIGQPSGLGILLCSQKIKQVSHSQDSEQDKFATATTASKAIWRMRIFLYLQY